MYKLKKAHNIHNLLISGANLRLHFPGASDDRAVELNWNESTFQGENIRVLFSEFRNVKSKTKQQ